MEAATSGMHFVVPVVHTLVSRRRHCVHFLSDKLISHPYPGLPAFKPGEKVEIEVGMDDDI